MTSKDTARQKSQDKFLVTDRSGISVKKNLTNNLRRTNSQRVLKESNSQISKSVFNKSPTKQLSAQSSNPSDGGFFVSVKKWIDYSSKYGIGYALTNGCCGVYFNDSSKMLALADDQFCYIDKVAKEDVCKKYTFCATVPHPWFTPTLIFTAWPWPGFVNSSKKGSTSSTAPIHYRFRQ